MNRKDKKEDNLLIVKPFKSSPNQHVRAYRFYYTAIWPAAFGLLYTQIVHEFHFNASMFSDLHASQTVMSNRCIHVKC